MNFLIRLKQWFIKACVLDVVIAFIFYAIATAIAKSEAIADGAMDFEFAQYVLLLLFSFYAAVIHDIFKIDPLPYIAKLFIHAVAFTTGLFLLYFYMFNKGNGGIPDGGRSFAMIFVILFSYFIVYGITKLVSRLLWPQIKKRLPSSRISESKNTQKEEYQSRFN